MNGRSARLARKAAAAAADGVLGATIPAIQGAEERIQWVFKSVLESEGRLLERIDAAEDRAQRQFAEELRWRSRLGTFWGRLRWLLFG